MVVSIFYDGFLLLIFIFLNYFQCDRPHHCGYLCPQPGSNSATLNNSHGTKTLMRQNERKVRIIFVSIFYKHFWLLIFSLNLLLHNSPLHCGNMLFYACFPMAGYHQQHPQHAYNNQPFYFVISMDCSMISNSTHKIKFKFL